MLLEWNPVRRCSVEGARVHVFFSPQVFELGGCVLDVDEGSGGGGLVPLGAAVFQGKRHPWLIRVGLRAPEI